VWLAKNLIGKREWTEDAENGRFGPGTNKCNLFVYNVLSAAGADPGAPNGYFHKNPPSAGQWGDPDYDIPGWEVLDLRESPQPGDVIAQKLDYSDASGHVMIVGPNNTVIGTGDSSNGPPGTIEQIPRPSKLGPGPLGPVIIRRYKGTQK
jgi:hypothetical protein